MIKYIVRRILLLIPTLIGVTFIIFTLLYFTPGDPALSILGENSSTAEAEKLREELGLNDPFLVQYGNYMKKLVVDHDLGTSYRSKTSVSGLIKQVFPNTIKLAVLCITIAVLLGVPLGIISAIKRYTVLDNIVMLFGLFGLSVPVFWLGLMLIIAFSVNLNLLPPSGFSTPKQMILPVAALSLQSIAVIMRMTRSSMLEVLQQDYIRTAKAKGLKQRTTIVIHALKNAFIPVLTSIGLQFGNLLGGAVLTESIFSISGLGRLMTDSIKMRDFPVVQGGVLVIAVVYCLINLIVDLLYGFLDPKIQSQYK
jgi:peptide/nickel transport system permease protein